MRPLIVIGRDDRIWTCDLLLPKQAYYQAVLHPDAFQLYHFLLSDNPLIDILFIFLSAKD